ncbi:uncharacterized protein Z519_09343 [Cladophialophora bantiana CBS 173.52]|uniref:BZIP domain-containing protein n=1 Tax=Cladophialophora bantiana (strain ATCC 10958 / CBS 173.52 / CDC B-1940 / NIH 8579) TaxID=1442370 RepID=A0A0D2HZA7_CLAB1|nr:uncharacterized protein Z519_09343 [Cladophialophora bantiana CBS 173.52]KIW89914.1 hypothetical protein Z519_09343 [Cladophialophora bantiana CBS 173.52]
MATTAPKSRRQLESENEELLRQVRVLQAKCRSLSSHNEELTYLYLRSSCHLPDTTLPDGGDLRDVSTRGKSTFAPSELGPWPTAERLYGEPPFPPDMQSQSPNTFINCQANLSEHEGAVTQGGLVHCFPKSESKPGHDLFECTQRGTRLSDCGLPQDFDQHCWQPHDWELRITPEDYSVPEVDLINNALEANAACSPTMQHSATDLPGWTLQDNVWPLQPDAIAGGVQGSLPFIPAECLNPSVDNGVRKGYNQARQPTPSPIPMLRQIRAVPDLKTGFNTSLPRGKLDQYISVLHQVLGRLGQSSSLTAKRRAKVCAEGVLWVVREAWPEAEHFWKTTASFKGFLQSEMWRNFPGEAVYGKMHPAYRPTPRQLVTPHSPLIDWLPWPELREKLIEQQDCLDVDLVCKTAIQNVVAHRISLLPQSRKRPAHETESTGIPRTSEPRKSTTTSFRVWDLCLLEEKAGFRPEGAGLAYTPKSAAVQALEKAYGLEYDNFQTQKLHPSFFETYPTLFAGSVVSRHAVQELPIADEHGGRDILGSPQGLLPGAGDRLQAVVDRALKAPC